MKITNKGNVSLDLAVWLLDDDYDYINESNYISVTRLMKPLKQIVLASRVPFQEVEVDIEDFIARRMGHSLHDSIEKAWKNGAIKPLKLLGYPENIIKNVLINPTEEQLSNNLNAIPVYLEQRAVKEFKNYKIGGKFDIIIEGRIQDTKSTSVYAWIMGTRDEEHTLQLSLYKWLNPTKVTEDIADINYIFTDWSKFSSKTQSNYPPKRVESKQLTLLTNKQIEEWVANKLDLVVKYKDKPESEIPECTDSELWRSAPQYKYFVDPTKTDGRSTKNFDNIIEANNFKNEKGKGIVITKPGEVKRCNYCEAFNICKQKDKYFTI